MSKQTRYRGVYENEQYHASVANLTVQGRSNPKKVEKLRNDVAEETPSFGPSSGANSMTVIKGVPCLYTPQRVGRRGEEGTLIESGHTGESYKTTDTRWSLKAKKRWFGVPEAKSQGADSSEMITISKGSGKVDVFATHAVAVGDEITWNYPPVNTADASKKISNVRDVSAKHGVPGYIPTFMEPVTGVLLTDCLMPSFDIVVKILNSSADEGEATAALELLKDSEDTFEKAAYYMIYLPGAKMSRFMQGSGWSGVSLAIVMYGGLLNQKGARDMQKFIDPRYRAFIIPATLKDSLNSFHSFHAAISSLKEACRPVGIALSSANAGEVYQLALTM